MASNNFVSRFKNKTFLLGKSGLMPVAFTNAIDKSEIPLNKVHDSSLSPSKQVSDASPANLPILPIRSTPTPLTRNSSQKTSIKTKYNSKSPLPVLYTNRSKSPIENASELILKGSHSRLQRNTGGPEQLSSNIIRKLMTTINN